MKKKREKINKREKMNKGEKIKKKSYDRKIKQNKIFQYNSDIIIIQKIKLFVVQK